MNEETIKGLKKRLKSLENKLERLKQRKDYLETGEWFQLNTQIPKLKEEIDGLQEILKPFLVAEEL